MHSTIYLKKITANTNGLVFYTIDSKKIEISFIEISKTCLKVKSIPLFYNYVLLTVTFTIMSIAKMLLYINVFLLILFLTLIGITLWKTNKYKKFEIQILLKSGECFKKKVSLKTKHLAVELIKEIRKKLD